MWSRVSLACRMESSCWCTSTCSLAWRRGTLLVSRSQRMASIECWISWHFLQPKQYEQSTSKQVQEMASTCVRLGLWVDVALDIFSESQSRDMILSMTQCAQLLNTLLKVLTVLVQVQRRPLTDHTRNQVTAKPDMRAALAAKAIALSPQSECRPADLHSLGQWPSQSVSGSSVLGLRFGCSRDGKTKTE